MTGRKAALAQMVRRQWAILAGFAAIAGLLVAVPLAGEGASAPYAGPSLSCRRTVLAGSNMTVVGRRFPARLTLNVRFDGVQVARRTTSRAGVFQAVIVVPAGASRGRHTITATAKGARLASCTVRVRRRS